MGLDKTSICLSAAHKLWLAAQPGGISKALRRLIEKAVNDPKLRLEQMENLKGKKKFLAAVAMVFHPHRAQELAGTRDQDLNKWVAKDPKGFKAEVAEVQRNFIDDCEWMVIECARGERHIDKSGMTGLIAFLNNHHPNWGRVKIELLSRIFTPIFDSLLAIVKDMVDETTYQQIAERFEKAKKLHFSAFSE